MGDNYKLYSILGVEKNDSIETIKKAYKKLAFTYHPDKNKGNIEAENKFKEISNAYNILNNEEEKQRYDMCGDKNYNNGSDNNTGGSRNPHDIFEAFFGGGGAGGFGNHFEEEMFGFGGQNKKQNKAPSFHRVFSLTLDDIYNGVKKDLTIILKKYCSECHTSCPDCGGKGMTHQIRNMGIMQTVFQVRCNKCEGQGSIIKGKSGCTVCKGDGVFNKEKKATLIIPKGVDESYRTAFPELGEQPKTKNTIPGDLIITIEIVEHKDFDRKGNDLYYKYDISFINSIIGENITIPYFKESIKINTVIFGVLSNGKNYLIEGKGMPILNTSNKGNMYIVFNITYPKIKNTEKVEELHKLLKEVFI
jgi:DnaJ-class molecular chaperone